MSPPSSFDRIGQAISLEDARVQRACAKAQDPDSCADRESRLLSVHFVRVRDAPAFTAPIVGDLLLVGRRSRERWQFSVVYRAADGRRRTWLRDMDWGYGPYLSGVRSHGGWIGLSGPPFDGDPWIYGGVTHDLRGEASTIAGQVLELHNIPVRSGKRRERVLSGSYFITRVDPAGIVAFRTELDIDMPCGEEVIPPAVMPPILRARASAFFDEQGRPRFEVKYKKGC